MGPGTVDHLGHRVHGAQRIGHVDHGRHAGARGEEGCPRLEIERTVIENRPDDQAGTDLLAQLLPGDEIGMVLHAGDEDFVALPQIRTPPAGGHQIDALGGSAHEDDAARVRRPHEAGDPGTDGFETARGLLDGRSRSGGRRTRSRRR